MKESYARREKRQPIPKRFSGDGSATAALSFGFVLFVRLRVRLASAPEREARG